MKFKILQAAVNQAHKLVQERLTTGGRAVDATAGNGHDTLFLADLVGSTGQIYAFDIQEMALNSTAQRLKAAGVAEQVELILAGHEKMADYIATPVAVIMFNLGYLPGGDHQMVTQPETTLAAIEQALELLAPGGLMTLVVYPGHEGGSIEANLLEQKLASLDSAHFAVQKSAYCNRDKLAPYLVVVEKANRS